MLGKIQMVSPVVLTLICGKKQKQNRTTVEGSWVLRRDIQSHTYTHTQKFTEHLLQASHHAKYIACYVSPLTWR